MKVTDKDTQDFLKDIEDHPGTEFIMLSHRDKQNGVLLKTHAVEGLIMAAELKDTLSDSLDVSYEGYDEAVNYTLKQLRKDRAKTVDKSSNQED